MFLSDNNIRIFVITLLHQNNILQTMSCVKIVGQMLAYGEDDLQAKFIQEHDILKPLQWVLLTANLQIRSDALWVLTNLTTTP